MTEGDISWRARLLKTGSTRRGDPSPTLQTFVRVVSRWLRRRARAYGIRGILTTGGVTVLQRFGSALNLTVHFHTLMIDGVYEISPSGAAVFHPVPAPTDEDVAVVGREGLPESGANTGRVLEPGGEFRGLPAALAGGR